MNHNSCICI